LSSAQPLGPDVARRVRARAARQRKATMAMLGGAAAVIALAIVVNLDPRLQTSPPVAQTPAVVEGPHVTVAKVAAPAVIDATPVTATATVTRPRVDVARLWREIEQLRIEGDARSKLIAQARERMAQNRRLAKLKYQLATTPDPLDEINRQIEETACIIVFHADRKLNELDLKESALADYRRVIKRFGQTHWAKVARQRLDANIEI
jgi:hypothetical protein